MITFIHTGDLHLGSRFTSASFSKTVGRERRIELWDTFKRIISRAKETSVDFLFIAGDIFEEDIFSLGDIKRLRDNLAILKDTSVIISTGNHDTFNENSLYGLIEWPENVYIFKEDSIQSIVFKDLNTVVWGFSWIKNEYKSSKFLKFPSLDPNKINILLAHGDLINSTSDYLPLDKAELEKLGFDYIALGHIHKAQKISDRIAYCGSPEPLNFGETGIHGIIEGSIDKSRLDIKLVDFSKRQFVIKELEVNSLMNYDEITNLIIDCANKKDRMENLYRIYLSGMVDRDIDLNIKDLEKTLNDKFYYVEIIDNTVLDYDLERIKQDNKGNVIGIFIGEMEKQDLKDPIVRKALYLGLESLLREKVVSC